MKKYLIVILFLIFIKTFAQSQNIYTAPTNTWYHDTLTTTIDTIDVALSDTKGIKYVTVSCYTTTGTDTLYVYTKSMDNLIWVKELTPEIITTTAQEFMIYNPQPWLLRLITPDVSANIVFTVNGKKEGL
jgi:hypothetical protein